MIPTKYTIDNKQENEKTIKQQMQSVTTTKYSNDETTENIYHSYMVVEKTKDNDQKYLESPLES